MRSLCVSGWHGYRYQTGHGTADSKGDREVPGQTSVSSYLSPGPSRAAKAHQGSPHPVGGGHHPGKHHLRRAGGALVDFFPANRERSPLGGGADRAWISPGYPRHRRTTPAGQGKTGAFSAMERPMRPGAKPGSRLVGRPRCLPGQGKNSGLADWVGLNGYLIHREVRGYENA
jgi:hypothetical protein